MNNSNSMYLYISRNNGLIDRHFVKSVTVYKRVLDNVLCFELFDGTVVQISSWRYYRFFVSSCVDEYIEEKYRKRLVIYNESPI